MNLVWAFTLSFSSLFLLQNINKDNPSKEARSPKVPSLLQEMDKDHPNKEARNLKVPHLQESHKDHPNKKATNLKVPHLQESHKNHPNKEAMPSRLSHLLLEGPRDHHPLLKGADPPDLPRDSLPSNLGSNDRYDSS